jgi:tRNA-dihydrouridine synthase 1
MLTKSFMAPQSNNVLSYTPMLHAKLFSERGDYRDHHFQPTRDGLASNTPVKESPFHLDGNPSIDRPLFVQFCANDPKALLEAARRVEPYCDAIDLNLGCPQGIARKGHYGAFLQEDWELIHSLVNTLHKNLSIPVTAKMRILETKEKTLEYARMILSAGASIITVHGRRREQKGHNTGLADWTVLRYLRENLPKETVIFANGNILSNEDLERCLDETGADAVMSAEGNLSDPTIFAEPPPEADISREYWRGKDGKGGYRLDAVFRRYLDIIYKYVLELDPPTRAPLFLPTDPPAPPAPKFELPTSNLDAQRPHKRQKSSKLPRTTSPNLVPMQGHLFHMLRHLVSTHHHVRDTLARTRAGDLPGFERVLALVEEVTREGLLDYSAHPEKYSSEPPALQQIENGADTNGDDTNATIAKYKRPWWVCQPYIRPSPKEALEKGSLTLSKQDRKRLETETGGVENVEEVELVAG